MDTEVIVISKKEVIEMFEGYSRRINTALERIECSMKGKPTGNVDVPVRRIFAKEIKQMMGISQSTFERIVDTLPLHTTKSGRLFCYEHDLIAHLFREHPPYVDLDKFGELTGKENLVKYLSGNMGKR